MDGEAAKEYGLVDHVLYPSDEKEKEEEKESK
jgi:ATP-dependent protease ClpP protease subunit